MHVSHAAAKQDKAQILFDTHKEKKWEVGNEENEKGEQIDT